MKRFKNILGVLILLLVISCKKRDIVFDLSCEYFFNEFRIESTNISKYKSFIIFLNFQDNKSDGSLYFVSYDLVHFNLEINLEHSLCVDSSTKVKLFFKDGSISEYVSKAENNCYGDISIQIDDLSKIKDKVIYKIEILNDGKYIFFDLDQMTQDKYEKMSDCFFKIAEEKMSK